MRRIDTDAVQQRGALRQLLAEFRSGRIDILVGTQMVAKGLNFPGVKLVGIVLADSGLRLPDFRAAERTFGLIVQVSGQGGQVPPGRDGGGPDLPARQPDHRLAAQGRLEEFYAEELENRRTLGFPPYTRLIRVVFRSRNAAKAQQAAADFARPLETAGRGGGAGARGVPPGGDRRQQPHPGAAALPRVQPGARRRPAAPCALSARPRACTWRWTWTRSPCFD